MSAPSLEALFATYSDEDAEREASRNSSGGLFRKFDPAGSVYLRYLPALPTQDSRRSVMWYPQHKHFVDKSITGGERGSVVVCTGKCCVDKLADRLAQDPSTKKLAEAISASQYFLAWAAPMIAQKDARRRIVSLEYDERGAGIYSHSYALYAKIFADRNKKSIFHNLGHYFDPTDGFPICVSKVNGKWEAQALQDQRSELDFDAIPGTLGTVPYLLDEYVKPDTDETLQELADMIEANLGATQAAAPKSRPTAKPPVRGSLSAQTPASKAKRIREDDLKVSVDDLETEGFEEVEFE